MNSKQLKEKTIKSTLFLCACFSIVVVFFIVGFLLYLGYPALSQLFLHGISQFNWPSAGQGPVVLDDAAGTLDTAIGAAALSAAIGIPCAIYMAEFAGMRLRNFTKTSLEVLDGFPSIVIGLLIGYELLVYPTNKYGLTGFLHTQFGLPQNQGCMLFGWLVLLVMSFPVIATLSEDALRAVPQDLREVSLGLGATRWQTTRHILLPSAQNRILTSIMLAMAAAMGEMVALSYVLNGTPTAALYNAPYLVLNPLTRTWTLTMNMESYYMSSLEGSSGPGSGPFALGCILFLMIGIANIVSRIVLTRGKATGS